MHESRQAVHFAKGSLDKFFEKVELMNPLPRLEIIDSNHKERLVIENYIKKKAETSGFLHILEAGCGRKWPLDLNGVQYELTGVDRDEVALGLRKNLKKDLHEAIIGDLRTVSIKKKFDIIYNAFVLEHIKEADCVLSLFNKWLKSKGAIIILIPDPNSVRGFITRITPHWFHIFCYKHILKIKNAGEEGYPPYPTYYSFFISRHGIYKFCSENNFTIKAEFGSSYRVYGKGFIAACIKQIACIISLLSFGQLSCNHCNLLYILEKNDC